MAAAPKDGSLYGFYRSSNTLLYRVPVTRIENVEAPFAVGKGVRFCPGVAGRAEWIDVVVDPAVHGRAKDESYAWTRPSLHAKNARSGTEGGTQSRTRAKRSRLRL